MQHLRWLDGRVFGHLRFDTFASVPDHMCVRPRLTQARVKSKRSDVQFFQSGLSPTCLEENYEVGIRV